jgi:hypothetical protein
MALLRGSLQACQVQQQKMLQALCVLQETLLLCAHPWA